MTGRSLLLAAACLAQAVSLAAQQAASTRAVDAVALTVSDAGRSRQFYQDVLAFRLLRDTVVAGASWDRLTGAPAGRIRIVSLALGHEQLELWQYLDAPGRLPPAMQSNDRWFQHVAIIVRNMDSAAARLERAGVQRVSPAPQTLPASIPAAAGIRAFYFRDPDGHPLEILMFPVGKGDVRWHQAGSELFQGIDHSAVVVWDTDRSLAFYHVLLGLGVGGTSVNAGAEQERLNNVAGAELRITSLRAPAGPGIEFLDYRSPRTGRPYPEDARPNDLLHWHTRVAVDDVDRALAGIEAAGGRTVSGGIVSLDPAVTGYRRAALVRDPDGHALELVEP